MIGGAITGALVSAATAVAIATAGGADNNYRGKVIKGTITGGAVATAAELVSQRRLVAPMTFGGTVVPMEAVQGPGNGRTGTTLLNEEGLWAKARGLELPSSVILEIPGWPPGTFHQEG